MVYAMQQFRYHLLACQFKLRTNHKTLQRLSVPVEDGGTPVQMCSGTQQYDSTVAYKNNAV